jgi:hypothetical protein
MSQKGRLQRFDSGAANGWNRREGVVGGVAEDARLTAQPPGHRRQPLGVVADGLHPYL